MGYDWVLRALSHEQRSICLTGVRRMMRFPNHDRLAELPTCTGEKACCEQVDRSRLLDAPMHFLSRLLHATMLSRKHALPVHYLHLWRRRTQLPGLAVTASYTSAKNSPPQQHKQRWLIYSELSLWHIPTPYFYSASKGFCAHTKWLNPRC